MSLLRQVAAELYSMFAADVAMTIGTVAIVVIADALGALTLAPPTLLGFGILAGCIVLLVARVFAFGRKRKSKSNPH